MTTATTPPAVHRPHALPRELVPGLVWLGDCVGQQWEGELLHAHNSVYLVSGSERSLIVDSGLPADWAVIERQLDELEAAGVPPVTHLFPTHVEGAHAGNVGRLARRYPEAAIVGDVRDYHLIFPYAEHQLQPLRAGDEIDLGGSAFQLVEAVIRDVNTSLWGYDPARRTLFPGDGFAYMHVHRAGHCGHTAEEVPDLPFVAMSALMAEHALYWTRFTDVEPHIAALRELMRRYPCDIVAPGHGLPVTDPAATVPKIEQGLRFGADG